MDIMFIYMKFAGIAGIGVIWFSTVGYPVLKMLGIKAKLKEIIMDTIIYTTYLLVVLFSTGVFVEIVRFIIY